MCLHCCHTHLCVSVYCNHGALILFSLFNYAIGRICNVCNVALPVFLSRQCFEILSNIVQSCDTVVVTLTPDVAVYQELLP